MLEWDQHWLHVDDHWFATVDQNVFLDGLHDETSPQRMFTEQAPEPPEVAAAPRVLVWKTRSMIEQLAELIDRIRPRRIVELGIATGGSVALLGALAPEAKVVAIEIVPQPTPQLVDHIDHWHLGDRLRPHYGVDQSDRATLTAILADEFGDEPIDLVIDDASHQLAESRTSFEILFPRVRPGGCYVIEDWAWAHFDIAGVFAEAPIAQGPPLTTLVCELLMVLGSDAGPIDRIEAHDSVRVWRGDADLDRDAWSVRDSIRTTEPVLLSQVDRP